MPKILFVKNIPPLDAPKGANLMATLRSQDIPVASSCNGDGICGKCQVLLLEGGEQLPPPTPEELEVLRKNQAPKNSRLSCQVKVLSPIKIDASYW